jgi:hypothetical protein
MIRQLPTVDFAGTKFIVDFRLNEFRELDNPHNRISLDALEDNEDKGGYSFLYNTNVKNVLLPEDWLYIAENKINKEEDLPSYLKEIHIPSIIELDPEGVKNIHL